MTSPSVFYAGEVPDAIQKSRQERIPLVVFLKGEDDVSAEMERVLVGDAASLLEGCVALRLDDSLESPDEPRYKNAKMFKQFFPSDALPTLMVMGLSGTALTAIKGEATKEKILSEIQQAKAAFAKQVQALENEEKAAVSMASAPAGTIPTPHTSSTPSRSYAKPSSQRKKPSPNPTPTEATCTSSTSKAEEASGISGDSRENAGVQTADQQQPPSSSSSSSPKLGVESRGGTTKKAGQKAAPLPVYNTTTLQFKLTNGEAMRAEFASDATLREVCGYLDIHRTDGCEPYVLETLYPRQKLGLEQHEKTLKDLDLVPRSTVMLTPLNSSRPGPVAAAQNTGLGGIAGGVIGGVGKVISFVNPLNLIFGGGGGGEGAPESENQASQGLGGHGTTASAAHASGSGVQNIPKASGPSGVRRRSNWGANVHGLRDDTDAQGEDDPSKNKFWNGNSTQFGGHED